MLDASDLLRAVVDPIRLAILGAAAVGPVDVDDLATRLGTSPKRVRKEVGSLTAMGLLDRDGRVDVEALRDLGRSLPQLAPMDPDLADGPWTDEEATVLSRFFSGRRLTSIPSQASKRRLVLERLVQEFEPGLHYDEREVNFQLQLFYADYATLRRYLVDEGLMTRADGSYWRSGGRVDAPEPN